MYPEFEKRIKRFLNEQPHSNSSRIIKSMRQNLTWSGSYYALYDNLFCSLGVNFGLNCISTEKSTRETYSVFIRFSEENHLKEKSKVVEYYTEGRSWKLCQEKLAKELTYFLLRIDNLKELINNAL